MNAIKIPLCPENRSGNHEWMGARGQWTYSLINAGQPKEYKVTRTCAWCGLEMPLSCTPARYKDAARRSHKRSRTP